jgi:hypothetical protein
MTQYTRHEPQEYAASEYPSPMRQERVLSIGVVRRSL